MLGQNSAAFLDRDDKTLHDLAGARALQKSIDRVLPHGLMNLGSDTIVGDDARVMFRERDEDQDTRAVLLAPGS